ncbi:MAG: serine hydrolase domain-containing protein [Verrucomicrobiia bacterium]
MKRITLLVVQLCALAVISIGQPTTQLPRSAPEAQGVASTALLEFVNALDQRIEGMHSLMIVRHGQVIAEGWWAPYAAEHNHVLYSLSKSFTSTAVGFAVAEGKLSIDDEVLKFFPGEGPSDPGANLKAMRVRDLLTMSTGHQDEPPTGPEEVSAKSFLEQPVPHIPGTHFKYNTPATFVQSAIVQKVTGQTVLDYLRPHLFEPLGIEHPVWDANFEGISLGGYGLRVRTEDIARFGQFYLQKGWWNGKPLLPAAWIEMASSKQVSNGSNPKSDWNQGYGFQFWRCRHNAFRGDGAFGQYCVVMPDQNAVIAITSGIGDMQAVLNLIWDTFLPACKPGPLPANPAAEGQLTRRLTRLELAPALGAEKSASAAKVLNRKVVFPSNDQKVESVSLNFGDDGKSLELVLRTDGKEIRMPAGFREWAKGRALFNAGYLAQFADEPVAGTFAWPAEDTLAVEVCAYETPFNVTMKFKFEGDQVTLEREANVSFGPRKKAPLKGRLE